MTSALVLALLLVAIVGAFAFRYLTRPLPVDESAPLVRTLRCTRCGVTRVDEFKPTGKWKHRRYDHPRPGPESRAFSQNFLACRGLRHNWQEV